MEIRRVGVGDWVVVRDLRLQALSDAPEAFGSSYEREAAFGDDVWTDRLGNAANATLLCETEREKCGMVTLVRDEDEQLRGRLVGMWVAPPFRRSGAADLLVRSVLRIAHDLGMSNVRLHVAEGNVRAERLYARHGFSRTGETLAGERPGLVEIEMQRTLFSGGRP